MTTKHEKATQMRGIALVVEDDPAMLILTRELLEHLGYKVHGCDNGDQALLWFRDNHQHLSLALLDRHVPGVGGTALFRLMHGLKPDVPIVVFSADVSTAEEIQLRSEGVSCVLHKPIPIKEFYAAIEALRKQSKDAQG